MTLGAFQRQLKTVFVFVDVELWIWSPCMPLWRIR